MKLQEYRKSAGITQAQLAEKSGVNKFKISRIERGDIDIGNVTLANAVALAKALGITAEELLN